MSETLTFIITSVITALTGGFGGWFFGRRKYNAEVKSSEIQNFNASIEAYKKLYEDRETVYQAQIKELKDENADLKSEVKELRNQVITITNVITAYVLKNNQVTSSDVNAMIDILKQNK